MGQNHFSSTLISLWVNVTENKLEWLNAAGRQNYSAKIYHISDYIHCSTVWKMYVNIHIHTSRLILNALSSPLYSPFPPQTSQKDRKWQNCHTRSGQGVTDTYQMISDKNFKILHLLIFRWSCNLIL